MLLAAQKMTIIVSFRQDSSVLTAARTAGRAAVCKEGQKYNENNNSTQ